MLRLVDAGSDQRGDLRAAVPVPAHRGDPRRQPADQVGGGQPAATPGLVRRAKLRSRLRICGAAPVAGSWSQGAARGATTPRRCIMSDPTYDVVVVGAGPSGLTTAARAGPRRRTRPGRREASRPVRLSRRPPACGPGPWRSCAAGGWRTEVLRPGPSRPSWRWPSGRCWPRPGTEVSLGLPTEAELARSARRAMAVFPQDRAGGDAAGRAAAARRGGAVRHRAGRPRARTQSGVPVDLRDRPRPDSSPGRGALPGRGRRRPERASATGWASRSRSWARRATT